MKHPPSCNNLGRTRLIQCTAVRVLNQGVRHHGIRDSSWNMQSACIVVLLHFLISKRRVADLSILGTWPVEDGKFGDGKVANSHVSLLRHNKAAVYPMDRNHLYKGMIPKIFTFLISIVKV